MTALSMCISIATEFVSTETSSNTEAQIYTFGWWKYVNKKQEMLHTVAIKILITCSCNKKNFFRVAHKAVKKMEWWLISFPFAFPSSSLNDSTHFRYNTDFLQVLPSSPCTHWPLYCPRQKQVQHCHRSLSPVWLKSEKLFFRRWNVVAGVGDYAGTTRNWAGINKKIND